MVPCFILLGFSLIGFYGAGTDKVKIGARIRAALMNPIIVAAMLGIVVALGAEQFRLWTERDAPIDVMARAFDDAGRSAG